MDIKGAERGKVHENRLARETSPYLKEHSHDPVDWYPWGEEAFKRAKEENKPIFLSIGYSSCHWCHVMHKESFEDVKVAEMMNKTFVNIKVDREERPDVDKVYMKAAEEMTGHGGWPLTLVLTPDRKPFFAATYVPKEERYGMLGLKSLIKTIGDKWERDPKALKSNAEKVTNLIASGYGVQRGGAKLTNAVFDSAFNVLSSQFDYINGGFSSAPKFPMPNYMLFLLRYWSEEKNPDALEMVEKTLNEIRRGGVYDQIGFGVHRYSTDETWLVPHFEKMLYDQALLAMVYAETYQATKKKGYLVVAEEILSFVLREMRSNDGGFFSAIDADSEGVEGKYYLWKEEELRLSLSAGDANIAINLFGVDRNGNASLGSETDGENVLYLSETLKEAADSLGMSEEGFNSRLSEIRKTLLRVRERRKHPDADDKILTDMNGLIISTLAKVSRITENVKYERAAEEAVDIILRECYKGGQLYHVFKNGKASVQGFLDDYAFLIGGLIDLYETTFDAYYLETATKLAEKMTDDFWDEKASGFYFTSSASDSLIMRWKEADDNVVPSGSSSAIYNLIRLSRITGDNRFEETASKALKAMSASLIRQPASHAFLLLALNFAMGLSKEIVIVGNPGSEDTKAMLRAIRREFIPNKVILLKNEETERIAGFIKSMVSIDGRATAYICTGNACSSPMSRVDKLLEQLGIVYV